MTHEQYLQEFKRITDEMYELTKRKNADYAHGDDAFANFKAASLMGVGTVEQGFFTRMTDKMMRLGTFINKGELQVKDEAVTDTLQDLAVYSILLAIYIKSENTNCE